MLFSSPDYPVFLIAVFFLYALARWGDTAWSEWGRIAVMVLLGDVVFLVVAKDPAALWDPVGGILLGLAADDAHAWSPWLVVQWVIGGGLVAGAVAAGRTHAAWLASARGQRWIALGVAGVLAALAAVLAIAWRMDAIDRLTAELVAHGHLLVLLVLGTGIGITSSDPHRQLGRVILLFVASSLFYHAWAAAMTGAYRYLLALLLATIVLDYYLAIWIERTEAPWRRKALVIVSVCSNLGILAFFKYADFLAQDVLGLEVGRLDLILPAGISFHTFQSLSYTIDVYRRELPATRSVFHFATFVLFFPQLVAGPIVRAKDLLPQLDAPPALELHKATTGLYRILVGLFKKIALADALALSIVDRVFEAPERYSSVEVLVGVYAYALQIYLDFSAYSDIAIGSALVLGFSLPENFRTPYRSANLQEFWRRWHISLSTWLRDYLYIALGGSKGAAWRTYLNLILTMLLGGLWHGASWAFVVWGALHGFGLAVTRYFQRAMASAPRAAWHLLVVCGGLAIAGAIFHRLAIDDAGVWAHAIAIWLYGTPLWALLTAWLGRERPGLPEPATAHPSIEEALRVRDARGPASGEAAKLRDDKRGPKGPASGEAAKLRDDKRGPDGPELLRLAMCLAGAVFLAALQLASTWTWIPLLLVMWGLGLAADVVERGTRDALDRMLATARRVLAALLVFHYVCFAWIFFRATSFENAQLILGQLARLETDHANLVPIVTTALAAGFACHFYPDGSFRWLRERFVALPAEAQGAVLAAAALVLRELGQTKIVPFIYFQF